MTPSDHNAEKPDSGPPLVSTIQPVTAYPASETTAQQIEKVEEEMSGFEKSTLRWARTAVIMSGLAAIFVCLQWWEMHTSGTDTHSLAISAGDQASRMQDFANRMKDQADQTKDLADRMKKQADETKIIAAQAVIQANANQKLAQNAVDTLANAKKSFRDEQRAWVGVQGTADSRGFTDKEPWQITVVFFNSGRTPAQNVQTSGMYTTSPVPLSGPTPQQIAMLQFQPAQSIAPQGFYRESVGEAIGAEGTSANQISGMQTLVSEYTQIKSKTLFLYYYGLVKYEDVSGKSHETQYCILLANPDTKQAGICDSFNDLN